MDEQHPRLNLVCVGLPVNSELDFTLHGVPCLLPVFDVVTKRVENQVAEEMTRGPVRELTVSPNENGY